jgi:glycosyltransferase involved in cell wall biosynthesis
VLLLDDVNETEKIILYKHAELFVFPSKYEGFGIPILEAMSLRCPLVLSDI